MLLKCFLVYVVASIRSISASIPAAGRRLIDIYRIVREESGSTYLKILDRNESRVRSKSGGVYHLSMAYLDRVDR